MLQALYFQKPHFQDASGLTAEKGNEVTIDLFWEGTGKWGLRSPSKQQASKKTTLKIFIPRHQS